MRTSELLIALASWLENSDNEMMLLADHDDNCLEIVANTCANVSSMLRKAASETDKIEPEESHITPENLTNLANIATAFDASGDAELKKQASLIDELLLTIAASKDYLKNKKAEEDGRTSDLKKKYEDTKKKLDKSHKIEELDKKLDKSQYLEEPEINDFGLKSRYCPDHPGVQVMRISETAVQCPLDKKVYDYEAGFKLKDGRTVPGTNIQNQTKLDHFQQASLFSSREERLGANKG